MAGIAALAYLSLTAKVLSDDANVAVLAIWTVMFFAGPGLFLPLEQEVSRAVASRRARGIGVGPVVRQAAMLGAGLTGIVIIGASATSWLITEHLFDGEWLLFVSLLLGIVGYAIGHIARGALSGSQQFGAYAVYIGGEAVARIAIAVVLVVVGYRAAGGYGLAIGVAPFIAVAAVARRARPIVMDDGPPSRWGELTPSLRALLAGSVLSQGLMNAGVITAKLIADHTQDAEVTKLFKGVVVGRLPLFLFQAVQAALLPKLSALVSARMFHEFRHSFEKLLLLVSGIGVFGAVAGYAVGPFVAEKFFNADLSHFDMGMFASGTAFLIVAMSIAQALIALKGQVAVALGWLVGMVVFAIAVALGDDLLLRIEVASLVASAAAAAALTVAFVRILREAENDEDHVSSRLTSA